MVHYRLISFRLCPYVQRAAILLAEKAVPFERVDIDLQDKPDWFLDLSPLGKVPVLVIEDEGKETVLFESSVIAEYLDEVIEPRLHPADPLEKARHRAWIEFASSVLVDIYALFSGDRARHEEALETLDSRFARLEDQLGPGPYFAGEDFTIVDAAFAPAFRYFETFDGLLSRDLFRGRPKLAAWRDKLKARPSVVGAVDSEYSQALLRYISDKEGHMADLAESRAANSPG